MSDAFVGSFQGLVTQWMGSIFFLHAAGEDIEAMKQTVAFISMQEETIQKELSKEKESLMAFLAKHRNREGIDFIQSRRSKILLEEDEGHPLMCIILPKLATILHDAGYFTKGSRYDIQPAPGSTGVTDFRAKRIR